MTDFALMILIAYAMWNVFAMQRNNNLLRRLMANIEERFAAMNTKLDEASTEILALIESLRQQGVTPAAEAILQQLEAKANALADIVPNAQ